MCMTLLFMAVIVTTGACGFSKKTRTCSTVYSRSIAGSAAAAKVGSEQTVGLAGGKTPYTENGVMRRGLAGGCRGSVDSAVLPALWASAVLLHPLLDSVFGKHVAACGDARVVGGDVVECDAALLFLLHGLGDDHWGNVWGQVDCSSSTCTVHLKN